MKDIPGAGAVFDRNLKSGDPSFPAFIPPDQAFLAGKPRPWVVRLTFCTGFIGCQWHISPAAAIPLAMRHLLFDGRPPYIFSHPLPDFGLTNHFHYGL
jgi:hypothetical protein